ncbi:MAG TPA: S24 family peptidase, partial [Aquella sp.]|nr:S24 family peptidase [Aquella sp.]
MNINKIRITNLKRIIFEDYNNSIHRFAKKIGRHSSQFYNLFKGDRSFGQKLARDLELLLNLEPLSLDKSPDEKAIIDKIVLIPAFHKSTLTNNNLAETTKNIFAIEKSVIECHNWRIDKLYGFITNDDSMLPTIPPNSKILIDISQTKIDDGKIYVLSKNNEIFIKRVFCLTKNIEYEAKSDNEKHGT